jgi:ribosomal protein S12 methylthiotransferase accessory factor
VTARSDQQGDLSGGRAHNSPSEWDFRPTPKVNPLSHRSVACLDVLARVRNLAARVPITRVSDLTPLDRLRLPTYSATTPLARDLTTHMGKGLDADSAQLSAMMEAVERVSAERSEQVPLRLSFRNILDQVPTPIDPRAFDLAAESRFCDDEPISWVEGWDLVKAVPVWIPLDLAISPPADGVLCNVDTNGLAAGSNLLEAVVHGICEVIERDALGIALFRALFAGPDETDESGRIVCPDSLREPGAEWISRIVDSGLSIRTELLDSDIGVPVVRTVLIDHAFSGSYGLARRFVGLGASPNIETAVLRSITEAVQSRLAIVQGARDSYNSLSPPSRPSVSRLQVTEVTHRRPISVADVPSFSTDDLFEDFRHLLNRLTEAGFHSVIVVNLTRPDLGLPVVRVRIPGLVSFAVNRQRIGWRCLRYLL